MNEQRILKWCDESENNAFEAVYKFTVSKIKHAIEYKGQKHGNIPPEQIEMTHEFKKKQQTHINLLTSWVLHPTQKPMKNIEFNHTSRQATIQKPCKC